jgi:glutathionyl-hydroquinone reductase
MGMLINGKWHDAPPNPDEGDGRFVRGESAFRNWVTADGSAGPSGTGGFTAEAGRYRLYVSLACPWAHRTLIFRKLKKLESIIPVSVVHWLMAKNGWTFTPAEGVVADPVHHAHALYELYARAKPSYSGRATVPVLWDCERDTIVNNESAEIIRMLNRDFDVLARRELDDLYPEKLKREIDWLNERIYRTVNNGVYRAGFATAQDKYEEAVIELFKTLDWLEKRLAKRKWLCGRQFTEADVRLFTTLVRFDAVYYSHFKCNLRRLVDYPNLWRWTRRVYALPGVAKTVDMKQIKDHYYRSMKHINPTQIVPKGPLLDFRLP